MTKDEILAELPRLSAEDRAEILAKLDELAGDGWLPSAGLSDADKAALDAGLAQYERSPDAGSSWEEVKERILSKLRRNSKHRQPLRD
jgi:putative addiction module component (TIGR02574 family)